MSKILVIDDDVSNADAMTMVLESLNFQVESIHRSDLLDPTIENFKPDLILMDILLDANDGRKLCNRLKANVITHHIPVVLITAMLESQVNEIPCSADSLMFKPFDYIKLGNNVTQLLAKQR